MLDFSGIKTMSIFSKLHLLEYFSNRRSEKDLLEEEAVIAAEILSVRMNNPSFLPDELNPHNWH